MIETLRELLLDYSKVVEDTGKRKELEDEIWNQYGAERTVLVIDMSGFSFLTRRHGVVHYLSMVRRMQETVRPIIHAHQGSLIKFEADNGFAVFPEPENGIRAAIALNEACEVENTAYPDEFDIRLSAGLDHGRILLLEGHDFFGDAVNTAGKLGEDLAKAGEILVSKTAMDQLPAGTDLSGQQVEFSISGLDLEAVSIRV